MDWTEFLSDVSKKLIDNDDLIYELKSESNSNWLGYLAASENSIAEHEKRLNTKLPPSYREFLKASNGFKQINTFIWDVLPLNKIDWLEKFDNSFYNLYKKQFNFISVPDSKYFVYGEKQDTVNFRSEYLINSLAISNWGDSTILLLNPLVKYGNEWEAWMFTNWAPGAFRYRSFEELMIEEFQSYLELIRNRT